MSGISMLSEIIKEKAMSCCFLGIRTFVKNGVLPPAAALARDMVGLGVAEKTKDRTRQIFERSAEQAGFFAHGKNRLIMPAVAVRDQQTPRDEKSEDANGGGGNGGGGDLPVIDPIIAGLLKRLPKSGDVWPEADRKLWLQLLEGSFKLLYKEQTAPARHTSSDSKRIATPPKTILNEDDGD